MSDFEPWLALATMIEETALDIFKTADVPRTEHGFADAKVIALTLLARSLSNHKGALILVEARRLVEARTLVRCCLENAFYAGTLATEGAEFVRDILQDGQAHRDRLAQSLFHLGAELKPEIAQRLRETLAKSRKAGTRRQSLSPATVAGRSALHSSHLFYGQLSVDAAHPSIDALKRHLVFPTADDREGGIDVDPAPTAQEIDETLEYLCMSSLTVCVAVNEVLGGTTGGLALNTLADLFAALSNKAGSKLLDPKARAGMS